MFFGQVHAQFSVADDAIEVTPGKTYNMEVLLTNTGFADDIYSVQFNMTLPSGIEAGTSVTFSRFSPSTSNCKIPAGKSYYTVMASDVSKSSTVSGESGVIVTIPLTIAADIDLSTPLSGTFTNMKVSTVSKSKPTWSGDGSTYTFSIKKAPAAVDITLANASGYNSYCCDKDLDVSGVTDAKFYVVSSVTASEATLTQVTTGIPAGEGFLIEGSGTANISVPVAATTPTATGSKLVGVTAATSIEAGNYILKSDGSSFVPCTAGTLPANKAYLKKDDVPASAKEFLMIVEDAVVTGINEIQAENSVNGPIYNLNGARVSNPQKGVYIMNGRKVIVK